VSVVPYSVYEMPYVLIDLIDMPSVSLLCVVCLRFIHVWHVNKLYFSPPQTACATYLCLMRNFTWTVISKVELFSGVNNVSKISILMCWL